MSAIPPPYNRQASFTSFQTPDAPTVGLGLEAEFNKVKQVTDATQARLAEIQRDDGLLRNLSVHPEALSAAVRALLTITGGQIRGAWATGVSYDKGDVVEAPNGATYIAAVPHLAGADFNVDLAAGRWLTVNDGPVLDAALRAELSAATGGALVGFSQPAGIGAVQRTTQDKLRETVSAKDFGAVGDGVADDTAALSAALAYCRSVAKPLYMPAGTYRTTAVLDISGVTIVGDGKGYRNANGTIIEGSGTHDVLAQLNATADLTRVELHNLRIRGGLWGVKVRYMLHSRWSNVHVTHCSQGGIQFGNSSDAGGLFCTFDNIETDVTGTGIDINGNQFVNANSFNQCFFKGTQYGGRLRCNGGIGAVSNMFNCTEFLGDRFGIEMENTSNTGFNECYFESKGPSAHFVGSRNIGWAFDDCTFAVLENSNPTGKNAFIYHVAGGIARGSIKGGWVYLANLAVHTNLSFVASEAPGSFFLFMADQPEFDVAASGFVVLNGLTSQNLNINDAGNYAVTWAASGAQPAIGNGSLSGRYSRSGNTVTVSITLTGGSTTTWGTGSYTFSLPYPAREQAAGSCYILDAGTGYFAPVALVGLGSSTVAAYLPGGANIVGATQPMTWATNDQITITLTYEC